MAKSNIRSISLPSRSHPTTLRIEEHLNNLRNREPSTSGSISGGLSGLEELYECLGDLLNSAATQQALSHSQNERWLSDALDQSLRVLDICGATRDSVSQIKEHVRDLRSCFRRKKADLLAVQKYNFFRKKLKKEAKRLIFELKKMENQNQKQNHLDAASQVSALIGVLRDVGSTSVSFFQSLLLVLSGSVSMQKQRKWGLISKLAGKERVGSEGEDGRGGVDCVNELDAALRMIDGGGGNEKTEVVKDKVEDLEAFVEEIENGLGRMFRHLIKTRASILNISSH